VRRFLELTLIAFHVLLLVACTAPQAEVDKAVEPKLVQVHAQDDLVLFGDYYAVPTDLVPEKGAPAVLLMHDAATTRENWSPLVEELNRAKYQVLAVDLRGFGKTGSNADAEAAIGDVAVWLEWLRSQPDVRTDQIILGGAGLGGHMAINGCAQDAGCLMVFALSPGCVGRTDSSCPQILAHEPGLDVVVDETAQAVLDGLVDRPLLLMAKQGSDYADDSVEMLTSLVEGDVTLRLYQSGSRSLSGLFDDEHLRDFVLYWLQSNMPVNES